MSNLLSFIMLKGGEQGSSASANWSNYNATNNKTPVEFSAFSTSYTNVVCIDSTRALIVYVGQSFYCRARIASINGAGVVSFGTEVAINGSVTAGCAVDLLDDTHAIIATETGGDVQATAIEFSGTTISTVGAAVSFETVNSDSLKIAAISSTEFFVVFEDLPNTDGKVYYGSVSGTTVTAGNGITYEAADVYDIAITKLATGKAIIVAGHSSLFDCQAYLLSVDGTTPQVDDEVTLLNGSFAVTAVDVKRIDDNTVIATYSETFSKQNTEAVIVTESSGSLTAATAVEVNANSAEEVTISLPNSTQAVVTVQVNETDVDTTVVEIDGTSLTALTAYQVINGDKEFINSSAIGTDYVLLGYEDDDDGSKGKAIVMTP